MPWSQKHIFVDAVLAQKQHVFLAFPHWCVSGGPRAGSQLLEVTGKGGGCFFVPSDGLTSRVDGPLRNPENQKDG